MHQAQIQMNQTCDQLNDEFRSNQLSVNAPKTTYMHIEKHQSQKQKTLTLT